MSETVGTMPGSLAPEFKLMNENEEWVSLSSLTQKCPLMIAFYPGDFGSVCTKQLCSYKEAYDRFVQYDIAVLGISPNSPEDHQKLKSRYQFVFHLLSDPEKVVTKLYGVTSLFLLGGTSRAVFILAKGGKVAYRYVEPTPLTHRKPDELLEILDKLRKTGKI